MLRVETNGRFGIYDWSSPTLPEFYNRLKIDEMWAGREYPNGGGTPPLPSAGAACPTVAGPQ